MTVEIRTAHIEPLRQTFDHVEARIGKGKAATRYQEAVHDFQMTTNFHYRPTWEPDMELFDKRRTAIVLEDFDALLDPRQYYYATYTIQRAKQQDAQDNNFNLVEKRNLFGALSDEWKAAIEQWVVPLRHFEWGANTNNCYLSAYAYGTPFNSAAMMQSMDRLGIAQYLTRLGLALEPSAAILDRAKARWMDDPAWQPLRRLVEDSMVCHDWFELHVLQNLLLDPIVYAYAYQHLDQALAQQGGIAYGLCTEFMREWQAESTRWTESTVKVAAAASPANKALLDGWIAKWQPRVMEAVLPLARGALGASADTLLQQAADAQSARRVKLGLAG